MTQKRFIESLCLDRAFGLSKTSLGCGRPLVAPYSVLLNLGG